MSCPTTMVGGQRNVEGSPGLVDGFLNGIELLVR